MGKAVPYIVALFLSLLSNLAIGQLFFVLDTLRDEYQLNDYLWVWRDTKGVTTWEEASSVAASDLFHSYSNVRPLTGRKDVCWGKLRLVNNLEEENLVKNWILWIGEGSYIDVFEIGANGKLRSHLKTGELVPAKDKTLTTGNRMERVAFSMKPGDTMTLLIRLQLINKRTPSFDMRLTREDFYHSWRFASETKRDWMFLGFLFTMFGFHLLLYLMTKDRAFLYQSLFLGCLFVFLLDFFAFLPDAPFLRNHQRWVYYISYTSQLGWDVFFLMFFKTYLNLKTVLPKWGKVFSVIIRVRIAVFCLVFPYFILSYNERVTDVVLVAYTLLQYAVVSASLWPVLKKKDPKSYFIIAATLFFILGLIVNGLYIAAGKGLNKPIAEWTLVSEVLLLTIGLAYRMKELGKKEKMAIRLEEQSVAKGRLYTNVTHEFRTPLTVIRNDDKINLHFILPLLPLFFTLKTVIIST